MTNRLKNMEVGETARFPSEKIQTLRVTAYQLKMKYGMSFTCSASVNKKTATVTRLS